MTLTVTYPGPDRRARRPRSRPASSRSPGTATVPSLNNVRFNDADAIWKGAPYNFTGQVRRADRRPARQLQDHGPVDRRRPGRDGDLHQRPLRERPDDPALSRRSTPRRGQAGQALTEFAFVLPVFILVMVGLFDLGRAVFSYNTITNAAREGARLAIVNQDVPASSSARSNRPRSPSSTTRASRWRSTSSSRTARPTTQRVRPGRGRCVAIVEFEATYQPITPLLASILFAMA